MDVEEDRKTRTAEAWLLGFMAGAVILALLGVAYLIGVNHGKAERTNPRAAAQKPAPAGSTTAAATGPGKQLFVTTCGACHTLSAAGTGGTTGPNLDQLKPAQATVAAAIAKGGTGSGVMPKGLYTGKQAQEVAKYVASVAGG